MTMTFRIAALLSAAALVAVVPAAVGAQDTAGSKDHPAIKRYAGSTIIGYDAQNYETLLVPTARVGDVSGKSGFPKAVQSEGQVTRIRYKAPVGRTSLEVFRNYETALRDAGFEILFSCVKAACGDGDTFAQTLYGIGAQPLTLNQKSQAYLSARLRRPAGEIYVRVFTVENAAWAGEAKTEVGQVITQLDIVEAKAMEGGLVTIDANAMRDAIRETGRVALYGIYFDSGKSELKPESDAALAEIAKLLAGSPSLRLLVVGHTDTVGSLPENRALSERRAAAVVQKLGVAHGVPAARLTPVGVGFAAPVATNRDDGGRAKNRRVELVEF
jgi:outer membrane protein OmpA-like peptidoglycan-associated protein